MTRHWTGENNSILGLVRIDSLPWYSMGLETEDRGNRLIMTAAVCRVDSNYTIAADNLSQLDRWADYTKTGWSGAPH